MAGRVDPQARPPVGHRAREGRRQDWHDGLSDDERKAFDNPTLVPLPEALRPRVVAEDDEDICEASQMADL
jgi:hypothetical protein